MIEYVIAHNIDDRVLTRAVETLNSGGLICFPTDTNWIIAANFKNKKAVERLYKIKEEDASKHFSLLCDNISRATDVAIIDDKVFKLLKRTTPGHYTFILEANKKVAKLIKASKTSKEVGLRFVPSALVDQIITAHNDALISTNVPRSLLEISPEEEVFSYMIEDKMSHLVEMIIDPGEIEFAGLSTIVNFTESEIEIVREGAGDPSPFQ